MGPIIKNTLDVLDEKSLLRDEEISDIFINEYGFKIIKSGIDNYGFRYWLLSKNDETLNEEFL